MTLSFDFFFSFRSPYSYLATPQIAALARDHDVDVRLRVVLPIAVRIPGFFAAANPLWPPYLMRDTVRISQMNAIPYRWPRPDPIIMTGPRDVARDQPYIYRVSRLGAAAEDRGKGLAFAVEAARLIWSGAVDGWQEGEHLTRAADAAGLDGAALEAAIAADPAPYDALIADNEAAQKAAGHWGVPLFVFEGEPFFGQDRIDHLIWRMKQKGLQQR
jgi:2-hydroxychromene-2-carboxylate isomerase